MIFFVEENNKKIFESADDFCQQCIQTKKLNKGVTSQVKCVKNGKRVRLGCFEYNAKSIYMCSIHKNEVESSGQFKTKAISILDVLDAILKREVEIKQSGIKLIKRLTHNLVSLNSHTQDELFHVIPQAFLDGTTSDQIESISKRLSQDMPAASRLFLRLIKNTMAMRSEFTVAKYLFPLGIHETPELKSHCIRQVVLNVAHPFFLDFADHGVIVEVEKCTEQGWLDYETFRVALFHLFDNATKYIQPRSKLRIQFVKNPDEEDMISIFFKMRSFQILDEDLPKLFDEDYSGVVPKKLGVAGNGQGLWQTKKFLALNKSHILVTRNYSGAGVIAENGFQYEDNCFEIKTPLVSGNGKKKKK